MGEGLSRVLNFSIRARLRSRWRACWERCQLRAIQALDNKAPRVIPIRVSCCQGGRLRCVFSKGSGTGLITGSGIGSTRIFAVCSEGSASLKTRSITCSARRFQYALEVEGRDGTAYLSIKQRYRELAVLARFSLALERRCCSSSQTSRAVRSAGLTPGMCEACPRVVGWIAASFSRASRDKVPMLA